MPDVFIASAVADSGVALLRAVEDLVGGQLRMNAIEKIGLSRPDAVRLTRSSSVAPDIGRRIDTLADQIRRVRWRCRRPGAARNFPIRLEADANGVPFQRQPTPVTAARPHHTPTSRCRGRCRASGAEWVSAPTEIVDAGLGDRATVVQRDAAGGFQHQPAGDQRRPPRRSVAGRHVVEQHDVGACREHLARAGRGCRPRSRS